MFDTVRQFGVVKQIQDDITHHLIELVGHCASSPVPSGVLSSFSREFDEFRNVPYVALSKTFQVGLLVDECLPDELGSLEFP
jgi:hypothetical protein